MEALKFERRVEEDRINHDLVFSGILNDFINTLQVCMYLAEPGPIRTNMYVFRSLREVKLA
jgi:hypothetical protein